jgi:hypothetical protein
MVLVLGIAVAAAGCAAPPKADIDAAKAALEQATAAGAGEYAAESLKAVQDAQAALDAELKAQEGKWFASYDKAKELATAVKDAGTKAAADAAAGKEKAKADATAAVGEAKTLIADAQALLDKAPKGKGSAADIEVMKTDLVNAGTAVTEAETALGAERFLDALAKAESAKAAATTVKTAVETAMAAKGKK